MAAPKIPENPLLDKNFLNAFVDRVIQTHSKTANTMIEMGKAYVSKNHQPPNCDVAGIVGMVAGHMKGTLMISYMKPTILKIYENLLGEALPEIDNNIRDAVGEFTNQIYGCAKTTLNKLGYEFDMAIPTVITGNLSFSQYRNGATLVIPFQISGTKLEMFVEITIQ